MAEIKDYQPRCVVSFADLEVEGEESRFVSCSIEDHAGYQNDTATVTLVNTPYLTYPASDTEFEVKLGYGNNLKLMGVYKLKELSDDGPPDVLAVTGEALDTELKWKETNFGDYNNTTVGLIAENIIKRNGGNPVVDPYFYNVKVVYSGQRNQSDMDYLNQLGERYGGIMKPLLRHVYFIRKGQAGPEAPQFTVKKSDTSQRTYLKQGRSSFALVVARWRDFNEGKEYKEIAQTGLEGAEAVFVMPKIYGEAAAAAGAAKAQAEAFQKSKETFKFTMVGLPGLVAESTIITQGFHPEMPSEWRAMQVTHTFDKTSGYTTNVTCEIPKDPPRGEAEDAGPIEEEG